MVFSVKEIPPKNYSHPHKCSAISKLAILFFVSAELPRELWHPQFIRAASSEGR